jgi:phosphoribosylformylglycinamidine synthase
MKFGVVVFPGTWSDRDCGWVIDQVLGAELTYLWHKDADLKGCDCVILPGGFAYGDYLRCGAMASQSNVMRAVKAYAEKGGAVLGICNGFQVLTEAGLLPGALMRNAELKFVCRPVGLEVNETQTSFTRRYEHGQRVVFPVAHGDGNYFADDLTLDRLEDERRVVFRYARGENPNGSARDIAGILNEKRNVLGLMPHPERVVDAQLGGTDGRALFESLIEALS